MKIKFFSGKNSVAPGVFLFSIFLCFFLPLDCEKSLKYKKKVKIDGGGGGVTMLLEEKKSKDLENPLW